MFYVYLIIYLLLLALLLALLWFGLTLGRLREGPWPAAAWLFFGIFVGAWFLGGWLAPFDASPWGLRWMLGGIILGGAALVLALAATLLGWALRGRRATERQRIAMSVSAYTFAWTALLAILLAVIAQHFFRAVEQAA